MTGLKIWTASIDRVFLGSFGARIGMLGIGFITSVALARLFGASALGQMSLVVALLVFTSHLSLFGAQQMVLKRLPAVGTDDRDETLGPAIMVTLIFGLLVGVSLSVLIRLGYLGSYAQLGMGFILALPLVVLANAYRVLALDTLRGLELIKTYNLVSLFIAAGILMIVIAVYLSGADSIRMPWVIFAIELLGMSLGGAVIYLTAGRPAFRLRFDRCGLGSYIRPSSVYFLSGSSVLVGQVDVLVAGAFLPIEEVGIYAIALRLATLAGLVLVSANISFAPEVSRIFRKDGLDAAIAIGLRQTRMLVPFTAAMSVAVAILGYPVLAIFGQEFLAGYPALLILIMGQMVGVLFGPVGFFLNMTMGQRDMVVVTFMALGVGLVVSVLLIPVFGIEGAAVANLLTLLVRNVLATAFLYWRTGTTVTIFHALKEKVAG